MSEKDADSERLKELFEKRMELAEAREESVVGNPNGEKEGYQWAKHFMDDIREQGFETAVETAMERTVQEKKSIEGGVGP